MRRLSTAHKKHLDAFGVFGMTVLTTGQKRRSALQCEWQYKYFQPVIRLQEKTAITDDHGASRVKRRYDQAQTPSDRLCVTDAIGAEDRDKLQSRKD